MFVSESNNLSIGFQNYIPELVREDIPQALRGQRNVIFGNIEKIYEFHSQLFLRELERCEKSPLMVGLSFLKHVSIMKPFHKNVGEKNVEKKI